MENQTDTRSHASRENAFRTLRVLCRGEFRDAKRLSCIPTQSVGTRSRSQ
ncbi:Uncharacterized protein dnm_049180 [Desulfonema magnum]|uniref:Uncharacterized protein n=1 Tax=Desulfonema magnum TaxID=45655 RepID=A0A975GPC6_9BACT|nr:Uncharacterized protein dnm_049180 [Desulfonema magnum]